MGNLPKLFTPDAKNIYAVMGSKNNIPSTRNFFILSVVFTLQKYRVNYS